MQIDEPYMQARPEKAREFGLAALARALDGIAGHDRRPHLLRLRGDHPRAPGGVLVPARARRQRTCDQISIETAQSNLDTAILETLPGKGIILGVIDLDSHEVETPETVAARIRKRAAVQARPTS